VLGWIIPLTANQQKMALMPEDRQQCLTVTGGWLVMVLWHFKHANSGCTLPEIV